PARAGVVISSFAAVQGASKFHDGALAVARPEAKSGLAFRPPPVPDARTGLRCGDVRRGAMVLPCFVG
ncbi:MAG TPA: hypothetical protein VGC36_15665, partial [Rhizomicrobium sp.]